MPAGSGGYGLGTRRWSSSNQLGIGKPTIDRISLGPFTSGDTVPFRNIPPRDRRFSPVALRPYGRDAVGRDLPLKDSRPASIDGPDPAQVMHVWYACRRRAARPGGLTRAKEQA